MAGGFNSIIILVTLSTLHGPNVCAVRPDRVEPSPVQHSAAQYITVAGAALLESNLTAYSQKQLEGTAGWVGTAANAVRTATGLLAEVTDFGGAVITILEGIELAATVVQGADTVRGTNNAYLDWIKWCEDKGISTEKLDDAGMDSLQVAWDEFYRGHVAPTMTATGKGSLLSTLSSKWGAFMNSWKSFYTVAKDDLRVAESVDDIESVDEEFLESACRSDTSEKGSDDEDTSHPGGGNFDDEWQQLADIYCELMKISIGLGETVDQGYHRLGELNEAGPLNSNTLSPQADKWPAELQPVLTRMFNVTWSRTGPLPKSGSCTGTTRRCQVSKAVKQVISKQTKTTTKRFGFSYVKVWSAAELTTYYGDKWTKWAGVKTQLTVARHIINTGLTIGALFDPSGITTAVKAVVAALSRVAAEFVAFKTARAKAAFYASCQEHCKPAD